MVKQLLILVVFFTQTNTITEPLRIDPFQMQSKHFEW